MTKPGHQEAVEGVVEGAKAKIKKAAGSVTGDERLEREAEAQEAKAGAQRESAKHESEAEAARAKARGAEAVQRMHQES